MFGGVEIYFSLVLQNFIVWDYMIVSAAIKLWWVCLGQRCFLRHRTGSTVEKDVASSIGFGAWQISCQSEYKIHNKIWTTTTMNEYFTKPMIINHSKPQDFSNTTHTNNLIVVKRVNTMKNLKLVYLWQIYLELIFWLSKTSK